jgi:hypothetical protein
MQGLWGTSTNQFLVPRDLAAPYVFLEAERGLFLTMGMDIHRVVVMVLNVSGVSFRTIVPITWDGKRYQWADVEKQLLVAHEDEPDWEDSRSYGCIVLWGA